MSEGERNDAATLIATDPAFTALEASGAPILAMAGEPLRVVYANVSAEAVFGQDPSARLLQGEPGAGRLLEMIDGVRHGAAPRLERVPIAFGDTIRTVTILCRQLSDGDDGTYFVIAALGLRAVASSSTMDGPSHSTFRPPPMEPATAARKRQEAAVLETPVSLADNSNIDSAVLDLRARLAERHGDLAPRFLWKTDAAGRFVDVTHVLGDVVGQKYSDLLGLDVEEASKALGLGSVFAAALASRKSWSGVEVHWPIEEPPASAPTTLGALPIHDAARRFIGFQGYGVLRLSRAEPRATVTAPKHEEKASIVVESKSRTAAVRESAPLEDGFPGANVVALRPACPTPQREATESGDVLSPQEQIAFDEIARTLTSCGVSAPTPPGSARDLIDQVGRAMGGTPAMPVFAEAAPLLQWAALIDVLPVAGTSGAGRECALRQPYVA